MTSSVATAEQPKTSNGDDTTRKVSSKSTLVSARVWEIYSPPPMNTFKVGTHVANRIVSKVHTAARHLLHLSNLFCIATCIGIL